MIATIVSGISALLYTFGVVQFAALTYIAYKPGILSKMKNRNIMVLIEITSSFVADMPLHLFCFQVLCIKLTNVTGGFEYGITVLLYYVIQTPTLLLECILFLNNLREIHQVEEAANKYIHEPSINKQIDSIFSFSGIKRLINPAWRQPKDTIIRHTDIPYCNDQEFQDIVATQGEAQANKLKLNVVLSANKSGGLKPVIVHIHGGSWRTGSKDSFFYPYEKMLISEENWVIVNIAYRLAPENAYPTLLIDVKRALRWVKLNIKDFGGDPDFILLAGDSSGGHLASMAALTTNEPEYQPGFENVDTSIRGVIDLNGVLDIERDELRRKYFSEFVAQQPIINDDFMSKHSPMKLVANSNNKKISYLIITGGKDAIVDVDQGKRFKNICDTKGIDCSLLVLPGGHHGLYLFWSPRAYYSAQFIRMWCKQLYIRSPAIAATTDAVY